MSNGLGYPLLTSWVLEVQVAGGSTCVRADAEAVNLNVTATAPAGPGWLAVYPCGTAWNGTSNPNGQTVANAVAVGVGRGGNVCISASVPTHVIVNYSGYLPAGSPFEVQTPVRLRDTGAGRSQEAALPSRLRWRPGWQPRRSALS